MDGPFFCLFIFYLIYTANRDTPRDIVIAIIEIQIFFIMKTSKQDVTSAVLFWIWRNEFALSYQATVQKLFEEGVKLNSPAVAPQGEATGGTEEDPRWVVYR